MSRSMANMPGSRSTVYRLRDPGRYGEVKENLMRDYPKGHNWASDTETGYVKAWDIVDSSSHGGCSAQTYCLRCSRMFCLSCDVVWGSHCTARTGD